MLNEFDTIEISTHEFDKIEMLFTDEKVITVTQLINIVSEIAKKVYTERIKDERMKITVCEDSIESYKFMLARTQEKHNVISV